MPPVEGGGMRSNMTIQELEQCISFYGKDIYSFCIHLTNSRELADDLYQDTFLEVMKKIADINSKANPKSYILSIAVRIWKNKQRKAAWRNRIAPTCSDDFLTEVLVAAEDDLLEKVVSKEEYQMLWEAINRLSDHLRIPVLLYYMEELSVAEIAKLLSLPQGTIKSRLFKARKNLEKELEVYFI